MGKIIKNKNKNKNILVGSGFFDLFVCGSSSSESKCKIEEKPIAPAKNASDEEWEEYYNESDSHIDVEDKLLKQVDKELEKAKQIVKGMNEEHQRKTQKIEQQSKKPKKILNETSKLLSQQIAINDIDNQEDLDAEFEQMKMEVRMEELQKSNKAQKKVNEVSKMDNEEFFRAELQRLENELDMTGGGIFSNLFACFSKQERCSPQDQIKTYYRLIRQNIKINERITNELNTLNTTDRLYVRKKTNLEKKKQNYINKNKILLKAKKVYAKRFRITPAEQKNLRNQVIAEERNTGGKRKTKKVRKHRGIHQTGGKAGKLKKGYKYSGKKLKNGKAEIVKCKSKKC
jgi:hypothetical protein